MEEDKNLIDLNTKETSSDTYFQYYSKLLNQQNMLQDYVRTSSYFNAIQSNLADFKNKIVMDVGTGSGILSIFSAAAGANKVYAIEASNAVIYADVLINQHNLQDKIIVMNKNIEDISKKEIEPVDVLISEPLGVMLINERMLESFLIARDKFLKKNGKIFPTSSKLFFVPFCDDSLYKEQLLKVSFWDSQNFFGLNMTCLREEAQKEKFRQPVIDIYDPSIHICDKPITKFFDFSMIKCEDLQEFKIDLEYTISRTTLMHGISSWFDTYFVGSSQEVVLSTSPYNPPTHWYQVRLLLPEPIAINKGQKIMGSLTFKANKNRSYYIYLKIGVRELNLWMENVYDLKDPEFRGYSGYTYKPSQNN